MELSIEENQYIKIEDLGNFPKTKAQKVGRNSLADFSDLSSICSPLEEFYLTSSTITSAHYVPKMVK